MLRIAIPLVALFLAINMLLAINVPALAQIPAGPAQQMIDVGRTMIDVFTYRSPKCSRASLLVVIHGLNRNAKSYRDYSRPIADRLCMVVVTPYLDKGRFPTARFQRGGIVERGKVLPPDQWTGMLALKIVDWARKQENVKLDYSFIGHSAGGQFLSRLAAFVPTEAKHIVIANPSTYVMPNLDVDAPYGLGGVYPKSEQDTALRRYLAQPVTIFLGVEDTGNRNLATGKQAMAQGKTRYERGLNAFNVGRSMARAKGWPFNWQLVELPGVAHSARGMFASQQASDALRH